jgi:hypothetical protein
MSTYLYHYGEFNNSLLGIFVSPISNGNEVKHLNNTNNHKIGVINLDIEQFETGDNKFSLESVLKAENNFITDLQSQLQKNAPNRPLL